MSELNASECAQPSGSNAGLKRTRFQRGVEFREIRRTQINPHPNNPNRLSDHALAKLRKSLQKHGLADTLVWNERTGTLIGGHHRMKILDEAEGYPEKCADYLIVVAVVSKTEKEEAHLLWDLNDKSKQGHPDVDAFKGFIERFELGISTDLDLTPIDIAEEFGQFSLDEFADVFAREKKASDPIKRDVNAIKDRKKEYRGDDNMKPEQDADYFLMVAFNSAKQKEQWLAEHGFGTAAAFISADEMFTALGVT